MKEKKTKNHKENWIGNIIRGFLLFMPLLAIGVTCAYAIFNKNAYQSYYGETINEREVKYLKTNDLENGEPVNIVNGTYTAPVGMAVTNNNIYVDNVVNNAGTNDYSNVKIIGFYYPNSTISLYLYDETMTALYTDIRIFNISFDYGGIRQDNGNRLKSVIDDNNFIFKYEYNSYSFVSEVFYYSIDKVQQSPLFNWATDTAMYNVVHGACTTLGIQTTFLPFLLSYWLLTYLIYIIYDIALLIVNMAHNKIHDVESSI